jgi:hypothetical protein
MLNRGRVAPLKRATQAQKVECRGAGEDGSRSASEMGEGEESQSSDMSSANMEYQLSTIVTTQPATPPKNSTSMMRTSQIKSINHVGCSI